MPNLVQGFPELTILLFRTVAEKKVLRRKRATKRNRQYAGIKSNDETLLLPEVDEEN